MEDMAVMDTQKNKQLFEEAPVLKAVVALEVPTVISQLITVVYNMADTYFVGQTGDPNQVAAASICLPLFMLLTGMANLFGIGGASLISRSLGKGDNDCAKRSSVFSIWTGGAVALAYGILIFAFRSVIFPLVGADAATYGFCCQYAFWVITIGAVPTVLSAAFAHLVRAEGFSRQASFGVAMGGILNIILDPVFISVFLNFNNCRFVSVLLNLNEEGISLNLSVWVVRHWRRQLTGVGRHNEQRSGRNRRIPLNALIHCFFHILHSKHFHKPFNSIDGNQPFRKCSHNWIGNGAVV